MARADDATKAFDAWQAAHERALKAELKRMQAARAEKAAAKEEASAQKAESAAYAKWRSLRDGASEPTPSKEAG